MVDVDAQTAIGRGVLLRVSREIPHSKRRLGNCDSTDRRDRSDQSSPLKKRVATVDLELLRLEIKTLEKKKDGR